MSDRITIRQGETFRDYVHVRNENDEPIDVSALTGTEARATFNDAQGNLALSMDITGGRITPAPTRVSAAAIDAVDGETLTATAARFQRNSCFTNATAVITGASGGIDGTYLLKVDPADNSVITLKTTAGGTVNFSPATPGGTITITDNGTLERVVSAADTSAITAAGGRHDMEVDISGETTRILEGQWTLSNEQ